MFTNKWHMQVVLKELMGPVFRDDNFLDKDLTGDEAMGYLESCERRDVHVNLVPCAASVVIDDTVLCFYICLLNLLCKQKKTSIIGGKPVLHTKC